MKDKFLKIAGVETEEEFYNMFPSEEAFFQAYPEARQMKKGGNVPTNPQLYSRVKSEAKQKFDRWPCVPVSTSKALTKEGWKSYFELEVGELILAYDMKTKTNKWTPILNLHYYENASTIDIIKPGHNIKITSTPDHKWVVYRKASGPDLIVHKNAELVYSLIQKLNDKEITFTEAKEYNSSIQEHYKKYKNYTWEEFLSESKFSKGGEFLITTEELKNGAFKQYVIKNAAPLDESYCDSNLKLTSKYNDSWTTNVLDMSRSQSEVWFSSAIIYDGNQQKDYEVNSNGSKTYKTYGFKQKHPDHQDAFVASCILTGRRVRYGNYSENGCRSFYITERDYIPLDTVYFTDGESTNVWCPETEFGTWVMNQNGLVTITGNSAYGSAWLVKTYKSRGGGYRKAQNGMEMNPDANIQEYGQNVLDYANSMVPTMIPMNPNQQSSGSSNQGMASFAMQMLPMLMAEGGKMPQWLAEKRFKAAGNQSMMDSYGYARGGQPCYECGGMVKRMDDGGEPDGEMALGQLMSIMEKAEKLRQFIGGDSDLEPWVSSKITMADDYIDSISDYLMYSEDNGRDIEVEEEEDYNMGEMEQMAKGGIPQRYKNKGFTKVGVKRQSTRPGKKWMVLAKKDDKYKVVHGGYKGMKDFSQHGSEKRKDKFWSRMGGKNSAKATDPFSPLYWHKRFGTWAEGGEPQNPGFQALPDYVQNKIMSNMSYGGDMESMYQMMKGGMYQDGGQQQEQIMQAIQMYAQMTQTDPGEIMKQLQSMPPEEQQKAFEQIMKAIQESQFQMKKGGIYIDPAKKGTFKAQATRMGMGVQEAAKTILNAPKGKYSPEMRKKANFARNFAKQEGGQIGMGDTMELDESEIQRLMDMGYGVEYID